MDQWINDVLIFLDGLFLWDVLVNSFHLYFIHWAWNRIFATSSQVPKGQQKREAQLDVEWLLLLSIVNEAFLFVHLHQQMAERVGEMPNLLDEHLDHIFLAHVQICIRCTNLLRADTANDLWHPDLSITQIRSNLEWNKEYLARENPPFAR